LQCVTAVQPALVNWNSNHLPLGFVTGDRFPGQVHRCISDVPRSSAVSNGVFELGGENAYLSQNQHACWCRYLFTQQFLSRPLAVLFMVAAWFTTVNLKYFYDAFRAEMHWGQDTHFNKRLRKNNKQKWGPLHLLHYIVLSRRRHKKTMTAESADVISRILFTLN